MARKPRILFMAESVTLAHVVRPAQLALALKDSEYEVHFATTLEYKNRLCPEKANFHAIQCMSTQEFQNRLDRGFSVFNQSLLEKQIEEDLQLLKLLKPEIVVGDFRHSLSISARLHQTPYMGIANAYWSRFDEHIMPLPEIQPFRLMGQALSKWVLNFSRSLILPYIFQHQAKPLNELRQKHGLSTFSNIKDCYLDADLIGFADAFEVVSPNPNLKMPYISLGPLVGSFQVPIPSWWNQIRSDQPLVYLNLGSTGNVKLIQPLIAELTKEPIQIILGYMMQNESAVTEYSSGARVFCGQILPGDLICQRADVVISNGGSGGGYQALMAGKPLIGISKNMDQRMNMLYMSQNSFVREIFNWNCSVAKVAEAVRFFLKNDIERKKANDFKQTLSKYDCKSSFELARKQLLTQKMKVL